MKDFHMSEERALDYPLNRAFALKNFVIESNPYGRVIYETPGYIGQEIEQTTQTK
jgi:hypothetical protein